MASLLHDTYLLYIKSKRQDVVGNLVRRLSTVLWL